MYRQSDAGFSRQPIQSCALLDLYRVAAVRSIRISVSRRILEARHTRNDDPPTPQRGKYEFFLGWDMRAPQSPPPATSIVKTQTPRPKRVNPPVRHRSIALLYKRCPGPTVARHAHRGRPIRSHWRSTHSHFVPSSPAEPSAGSETRQTVALHGPRHTAPALDTVRPGPSRRA